MHSKRWLNTLVAIARAERTGLCRSELDAHLFATVPYPGTVQVRPYLGTGTSSKFCTSNFGNSTSYSFKMFLLYIIEYVARGDTTSSTTAVLLLVQGCAIACAKSGLSG